MKCMAFSFKISFFQNYLKVSLGIAKCAITFKILGGTMLGYSLKRGEDIIVSGTGSNGRGLKMTVRVAENDSPKRSKKRSELGKLAGFSAVHRKRLQNHRWIVRMMRGNAKFVLTYTTVKTYAVLGLLSLTHMCVRSMPWCKTHSFMGGGW